MAQFFRKNLFLSYLFLISFGFSNYTLQAEDYAFKLDVGVNYLYGQTREMVRATATERFPLESMLVWEKKHIIEPTVSGEGFLDGFYYFFDVRLPLDIFQAGKLIDLDWQFDNNGNLFNTVPGFMPSNFSQTLTKQDFSINSEIRAGGKVMGEDNFSMVLGGSFQYSTWGWQQKGASDVVSLITRGAIDLAPKKDVMAEIKYRLHLLTPSVLLRMGFSSEKIQSDISVLYSPSAIFISEDQHIAPKKMDYKDFGFLGQRVQLNGGFGFWFTEMFGLRIGIEANWLFFAIGSTTETDKNTNTVTHNVNDAALNEFELRAGLEFVLAF